MTGVSDQLTYPTRGPDGSLTWTQVPSGSGHARETLDFLNKTLVPTTPLSDLQSIDKKIVAIKRNMLDRIWGNKKQFSITKWVVSVALHCKFAWLSWKLDRQMEEWLCPFHAWNTGSDAYKTKLCELLNSALLSKLSSGERKNIESFVLNRLDKENVKSLLQRCPEMVNLDDAHRTLLDVALEQSDFAFLQDLINKAERNTVMIFLLRSRNLKKLSDQRQLLVSLVEKGSYPDEKLRIQTLLREGWEKITDSSVLDGLLAHVVEGCSDETLKSVYGWRFVLLEEPLLNAVIMQKKPQTVRALLKRQVNPNTPDSNGITALHIAAQYAPEIIPGLLASGANPNVTDKEGRTPLHYARSFEAVQLLLKAGAKADKVASDGTVPLHYAQDFKTLQLLLEKGANPNAVDKKGQTLLHKWDLTKEEAELLLDHGAQIEQRDRSKRTPLYCAVEYNNVEVVELLLQRGADRNAKDSHGSTPLTMAQRAGSEMAELFKQK